MVIAFTRTIILYLLIIAGIRLMGKRQVGELEPSELVLDLIIADLAAVPMQDFGIPLLSGVIPILTLLCVTMILSVLTMKHVRFRALICGRPSIVVQNGQLNQREMRRNRFTVDELNDIKTAVSEAVTNCIIHGYEGEIHKIRVECRLRGQELQVDVTDHGAGIPDIKKAMEPLFTTKADKDRSGMGFTFMEAFMDELQVESEVGRGTTVHMKKIIRR